MVTYSGTPLSRDDETLAWYLRAISHLGLLTREEEQQLAYRAQQGEEGARARLIEANLRFVVSIAKGYTHCGMPLSDLIEEGNLGLIEAIGHFDPGLGNKFISYAVWWIRAAIYKALSDRGRVIRLPSNQVLALGRVLGAARRIEQEAGHEVSLEELARDLEMSPEAVEEVVGRGGRMGSLDAPLYGEEEERCLRDRIDSGEPGAEEEVMERQLHEAIDRRLEALDRREAEIVRLYYGLEGGDGLTLGEIAQRYGVTRERVRQIKQKALSRLRYPSRSKRLREFWENAEG